MKGKIAFSLWYRKVYRIPLRKSLLYPLGYKSYRGAIFLIIATSLLISVNIAAFDAHDLQKVKSGSKKLNRVDLSYANLQEYNLRKANLSRSNLRAADLRGVNLSYANLFKADLEEADLSWANLREADLSGANLKGAKLIGADLNRGSFLWNVGTSVVCADLSGADLTGANLKGVNFAKANFTGAILKRTKVKRAIFHEVEGLTKKQKAYLRAGEAVGIPR